jgi:hypothetical protein
LFFFDVVAVGSPIGCSMGMKFSLTKKKKKKKTASVPRAFRGQIRLPLASHDSGGIVTGVGIIIERVGYV